MTKKLISIAEAAAMLGIGRSTAYALARQGKLPTVKSFGPTRVHLAMLQQMIDQEADFSMSNVCQDTKISGRSLGPEQIRSRDTLERELDELLTPRRKHRVRPPE